MYASGFNNGMLLQGCHAESNSAVLSMFSIILSNTELVIKFTLNEHEMKSGKHGPYLRKDETDLSMTRNVRSPERNERKYSNQWLTTGRFKRNVHHNECIRPTLYF